MAKIVKLDYKNPELLKDMDTNLAKRLIEELWKKDENHRNPDKSNFKRNQPFNQKK